MWKTYLRILNLARPFRKFAFTYVIFQTLAIIFGIFNFAMLIPILNVIFKADNLNTQSLPEGESFSLSNLKQYINYLFSKMVAPGGAEALLYVCVILVVSVFASNLFTYLSQRILANTRATVIERIRRIIYDKIASLHIGYYTNENRGDIISRMTTDVQEIERSVINTLNVLFKDPATIILTFAVLFMYSAKLTFISILILPISGVLIGEITKRLRSKAKEGQSSLGVLLSLLDETITGIRVIKAFNAEKPVKKRFQKINDRYASLVRSIAYKRDLASPTSQFLGACVMASILYIGGSIVLENQTTGNKGMTGPEFITYIAFFVQIIAPLKSLSSAFSNIQRGMAAGERVFELVDTEPAIKDKPNATKIKTFNEKITLENLHFAYKPDEPVLKNINLTVKKGQSIALVGPSGAGKSTLMDLIPRFHDPVKGAIYIDGHNIMDCDVHSIRDHIGVVTQEPILFNDSVRNNIAFGMDASDEEIQKAAEIANAHEFIVKLEDKYETNIGDRGMKLSGGQRQRLTIARAVLKNPPILLLDEATSSLDSESEKLVQEALFNLMKNRTSIIIAHRLSTIQHADMIIVLKDGEIIEKGDHSSLIAQGGLYKKLNKMQTL